MKIYRDSQGKCINIGDWDFMFDKNEIAINPLPEDAVESDEEVVVGWDDGRYVHNDPKKFKS